MKKFIKTTMIILLGMIYMTANAQSVIVKAGYNLSNLALGEFEEDMNYSEQDEFGSYKLETTQKMLGGYHVSVLVDFPFNDKFSLETGLSYTTRGTELKTLEKESYRDPFSGLSYNYEYSENVTYSLSFLEVPLTAKVRFPVSDLMNIYTQGGIYAAYGILGKTTVEGFETDEDFRGEFDSEEDIDWDETNRFDAGATIGAGVEIGPVSVGASFDMGLVSLDKIFNVFQNRNLKFSVGYTIASRK